MKKKLMIDNKKHTETTFNEEKAEWLITKKHWDNLELRKRLND